MTPSNQNNLIYHKTLHSISFTLIVEEEQIIAQAEPSQILMKDSIFEKQSEA